MVALVREVIVVQVEPLRVYSSFTFVTPEDVQLMAWELPVVQLSPPLGDVTVTPVLTLSAGTRKSLMMAMCCMLVEPLSALCAGEMSDRGEYTRVSTPRPAANELEPMTVAVW